LKSSYSFFSSTLTFYSSTIPHSISSSVLCSILQLCIARYEFAILSFSQCNIVTLGLPCIFFSKFDLQKQVWEACSYIGCVPSKSSAFSWRWSSRFLSRNTSSGTYHFVCVPSIGDCYFEIKLKKQQKKDCNPLIIETSERKFALALQNRFSIWSDLDKLEKE